jgi:hypothetical protein
MEQICADRPLMDYTQYLSAAARERKESPIRALFPLLSIPGFLSIIGTIVIHLGHSGIISLGSGNPNPAQFPFASVSFKLKGIKY